VLRTFQSMATFSSGVATGLMVHPKTREVGAALAATTVPLTIASKTAYDKKRVAFRDSPRNLKNLDRIFKTEDRDWLRQIDYEFVKKYAVDPHLTEKQLKSTTVGTARKFASNHGLWKAPNDAYSMRRHENEVTYNLMRPILQNMVHKLPETVDKRALLDQHFPKEKLKPEPEMPKAVLDRIPPRVLDATPTTEHEAVALTILAGSLARAHMKDFKNEKH